MRALLLCVNSIYHIHSLITMSVPVFFIHLSRNLIVATSVSTLPAWQQLSTCSAVSVTCKQLGHFEIVPFCFIELCQPTVGPFDIKHLFAWKKLIHSRNCWKGAVYHFPVHLVKLPVIEDICCWEFFSCQLPMSMVSKTMSQVGAYLFLTCPDAHNLQW